jgi:hypothetical protein
LREPDGIHGEIIGGPLDGLELQIVDWQIGPQREAVYTVDRDVEMRSLSGTVSGTFSSETVAELFEVPYWLLDGAPRPSWFRRPIWRLRARRWSRG